MSKIQYRSVEAGDYDALGEIINQAFGLFRYVPDREQLEWFKKQYVYSCLSEATYTCAAVRDGTVVGVIMGNAKTDYHPLRHLPYVVKMLFCTWKMKRRGDPAGMDDFERLHKIYRNFSERHPGEFDGVLTLFAVNADCRGCGVGKHLLSGFLEYLNRQNVKRIYLYTDTTCNYGFYEHQGFGQLEMQPITLTKEGKLFQMDVFLYGLSLAEKSDPK